MALQKKIDELGDAKGQLQQRVGDLTKSRDELQVMVENLVDTRGVLEKQVASLSQARDAAVKDAKSAQTKIDQLGTKLKVQTQQMAELQGQIVTIRSVLEQLQQKLE
jgi:chromosome segregation ATPase